MPYPQSQSHQPSDLEQLAQIMQLMQPFQQQHQQQVQQDQLMQYHQQQLQQAAQQHQDEQRYRQDALAQSHAQHLAELAYKDRALGMEEKTMSQRMLENVVNHGITTGSMKPEMGLKLLGNSDPRISQALHQLYGEQLQQQIGMAQPIAAGVFGGSAIKDVPTAMHLATALASAGIKPTPEVLGGIDYSGMNPYPGYEAPQSGKGGLDLTGVPGADEAQRDYGARLAQDITARRLAAQQMQEEQKRQIVQSKRNEALPSWWQRLSAAMAGGEVSP